jgi:hypothetical protein
VSEHEEALLRRAYEGDSFDDENVGRLVSLAIELIKKENPVPTDLTARLLEAGIDVSAIEDRFSFA